MPQTFSSADVTLAALDARLQGVFTAGFGIVHSYDRARQTVDVQPAVRQGFYDEQGERVAERHPVIPMVPVMFPKFGPFRIVASLKAGDVVLLVHLHHSKDRFVAEGGEVDPGDDRRHTLTDCVAFPGVISFKNLLKKLPTSGMSIGHDGSGPTIEIDDTTIKLGGSGASSNVVVQSALDAFGAALNAAIPTAGIAAPALTALRTALGIDPVTGRGWSAGTSKVKAE